VQLNLHKCIFNIVQFLQTRQPTALQFTLLFWAVVRRELVKSGVPANDIQWVALRENFKSISVVARIHKILMLQIKEVD